MTTKEQERKALEQIRKIVEGLGENSYIGTAFEGCFEIAENNIENDFACSMKQRKESAEFAEDQLREKLEAAGIIRANLEKENVCLNDRLHQAEERINKLLEEQKFLTDQLASASYARTKNESLEVEIIRLKAKLYDYMAKEESR